MITFSSSTFSGSESSGVISATVIISGGVVSSSDITVPITFTEGTATSILSIAMHRLRYFKYNVIKSLAMCMHISLIIHV